MSIEKILNKGRRKSRYLLGVSSSMIGTGRGDIVYLDFALSLCPYIKNVVELGTWGGITSMYLGFSSKLRDGRFTTFDIEDKRVEESKKHWLDNMTFVLDDILTQESQKVIDVISKEPTFLFVDNGDKKKEFNMYTKYLTKGSVVVVHDWNDEIFESEISETIKKLNLREFFPDVAHQLFASCRGWVVV